MWTVGTTLAVDRVCTLTVIKVLGEHSPVARPMKDIDLQHHDQLKHTNAQTEVTTETNTEPHGTKGKKGGPAG